MKVFKALLTREVLEHRGAFFYAPAALLLGLIVLVIIGISTGESRFTHAPATPDVSGATLYQFGLLFITGIWSAYLLVALFFYYADSFSADRRNNSLLFWKSMPQSDFKVLGSKALAGVTVFPALILGFAVLTGILLYPLSFVLAARIPFMPIVGPAEMLWSIAQTTLAGAVYFILTILWYAPFLAWVAGLSTLVKRWSIPLAFVIPGVLVLAETISTVGRGGSRPILSYLVYRGEGIMERVDMVKTILHTEGFTPLSLIGTMLANVDWVQLALGLALAVAIVLFASEYRRRWIDA